MKPFEYVTILLSILLGVCISQMIMNIVQVIQIIDSAVLYLPHILWNLIGSIAILAHWVHFYQAEQRESWNSLQILLTFLTPLVYYLTAQILFQVPTVQGKMNYQVLFESKRHLIYLTGAAFTLLTMFQNYFVYENRNPFLYCYYGFASLLFIGGIIVRFPFVDYIISIGVFLSETLHHFVVNPLQLSRHEGKQGTI